MSFLNAKPLQITVAAALAIFTLSLAAQADEATRRSVRMLVPCPAGTPTDLSARAIAHWWSTNTDARYFVENLPFRTASIDASVIVRALEDSNVMLFDLGDCNNSADVE
jgi:hypothetical protein